MEYTEDLERIARVDSAPREEAQPRGRRSPRPASRPAPTSTSARSRSTCSATSSVAAARSHTNHQVTWLKRQKDGTWRLSVTPHSSARRPRSCAPGSCSSAPAAARSRCCSTPASPRSRASAGSRSRASSSRTTNPKIVAQHQAKVYGKAAVGAPPMSVPHLDTRVVDGETALLFGPYAGLHAEVPEVEHVVRPAVLDPARTTSARCSQVGLKNFDLVKYLVAEVLAVARQEDGGPARVHAHGEGPTTGSSSPPASACRS